MPLPPDRSRSCPWGYERPPPNPPPSVTVAPAGACDLGAGSDREQRTGLRAGWAWGAQGHAPGRPRDLGGVPSSLRWVRAAPRFPSIKNARQEESTRQDSSRREGDEDPPGSRVPGPPPRSQALVRVRSRFAETRTPLAPASPAPRPDRRPSSEPPCICQQRCRGQNQNLVQFPATGLGPVVPRPRLPAYR